MEKHMEQNPAQNSGVPTSQKCAEVRWDTVVLVTILVLVVVGFGVVVIRELGVNGLPFLGVMGFAVMALIRVLFGGFGNRSDD